MPTIDAATVRAVFEADIADLVANTKRAADSVEHMANKTDESGKRMSAGMGLAGAAIATALAGAAKASIDNTLAFEKSMTSVSALVGATDAEMEQYTGTVRRVGVETGVGAKQAADALYFLTSSGLDAAKSQDALEITAKAAAAGLGEQADIADMVSSAMNAYASTGLTAGKATDIATAAIREGKIEAASFAQTIGKVIPSAAQLGVSFDQVSAAVAAMSLTGMDAGEAVTRLDYAMRSMAAPSARGAKVMAEFGISGEMLRATIREKGLYPALQQLREAFKGNEDQLVRGLGSIQAYQAVMALTGENAAQVEQVFADVADSSGDLNTAFEKVAETSGHKLSVAMAELQDASIDVGATLVPVAATVVSSLSGMVSGFTDMSTGAQIGAVAIIGLLPAIGTAGKAIDGLTGLWGGLQKAFAGGAMAGPIGLGVTAAAAGVAYAFMEMKERAEEAKAKQEALTASMVASQDPTFIAAQRYTELVASLEPIPDAAGAATDALTGKLGGTSFVADQLGAKWGETFANIGYDAETLWKLIQSGTDVFENSGADLIDSFGKPIEKSLRDATAAERDFIDALADGIATGEISKGTANEMIEALDLLADSSDDARESLLEQAKADVGLALSKDASLKPIIDQALASSQATDDLGRYHDALAAVSNVNEMFKQLDMEPTTTGLVDAADATMDMEQAEKDAEEATKALDAAMKELTGRINDYVESALGIDSAKDSIVKAMQEMTASWAENGTAIFDNSEVALENRDMLRGYVDDAAAMISTMVEQKRTTEEQSGALANLSLELETNMRNAGFSEEAIAQWTATLLGIPTGQPGLETAAANLSATGDEALTASGQVAGVGAAVDGINGKSAVVSVYADTRPAYEALNAFYNAAVTQVAAIPWSQPAPKAAPVATPFKRMATGGHLGPGDSAIVGEDGWELATWNNGGVDIIPQGKIAGSMMGGSASAMGDSGPNVQGGGDTYIIQAHPDSRGQYEARRMYDGLTREKRRRGGELAVTG